MSSRMFQNVILQMKEATDRRIGVIDADGSVVSCTDPGVVGEKWAECIIRLSGADESVVHFGGMTLRPLSGDGAHFEFAVFVDSNDNGVWDKDDKKAEAWIDANKNKLIDDGELKECVMVETSKGVYESNGVLHFNDGSKENLTAQILVK